MLGICVADLDLHKLTRWHVATTPDVQEQQLFHMQNHRDDLKKLETALVMMQAGHTYKPGTVDQTLDLKLLSEYCDAFKLLLVLHAARSSSSLA